MNSIFSTLARFLGFIGDAPQPEKSEAEIVRSSSATAKACNKGVATMSEESDDDDFHTSGGMSFVRTMFAIATVWVTAIATVAALGS